MDTIRFEINKKANKRYRKFYDVVLFLNGKLVKNNIFNVSSVLGACRYNGVELYPFTCDCGEPGCAGFFSEIKQVRTESNVKWIFPNTESYKVDKLEYCFDIKQFDFQLGVLKHIVNNLAKKKRVPVCSISYIDYNILGDIEWRKKRFKKISKSYENLLLNFPEYINNTYYYKYEEQVSWEYNFQDLVYSLVGDYPEYSYLNSVDDFNLFLNDCIEKGNLLIKFMNEGCVTNTITHTIRNFIIQYEVFSGIDNFKTYNLQLVQK